MNLLRQICQRKNTLLKGKYDKEFDLLFSYHIIYVYEWTFKYSVDLYLCLCVCVCECSYQTLLLSRY